MKPTKTDLKVFKLMLAFFMAVAVLLAFRTLDLRKENAELRSNYVSAKIDLKYYQDTFKERVGVVYNEYDSPETIRVVSIDQGRNWIVVSKSREVQNERYLSIAYPNVNPDSLEVVE